MILDNTRLMEDIGSMADTISVYSKDLGSETATMLLSMFLEDTAKQMVSLDGLSAGKEREELRKVAHKLKGSFAQMGAEYTASLSGELESSAHGDDPPEIKARVKLVQEAWQGLQLHLKQSENV